MCLRPADNGMAELTVHDSGVGVDAEALPYLFSRQRPQDPSKHSARAKYGRGLGLIRDIIDLHGGTIKAETDGEVRRDVSRDAAAAGRAERGARGESARGQGKRAAPSCARVSPARAC